MKILRKLPIMHLAFLYISPVTFLSYVGFCSNRHITLVKKMCFLGLVREFPKQLFRSRQWISKVNGNWGILRFLLSFVYCISNCNKSSRDIRHQCDPKLKCVEIFNQTKKIDKFNILPNVWGKVALPSDVSRVGIPYPPYPLEETLLSCC